MKNVVISILIFVGLSWAGNAQGEPIDLNFLQKDVDQAIEQLAADLSEYNPQAFEKFYQDLQREAAQIRNQIGKAPFKVLQRKIWRLFTLASVANYAALAKAHVTGKPLSNLSDKNTLFIRSNRALWDYEERNGYSGADIETNLFAKNRFMKRHPSIVPYFNSFE